MNNKTVWELREVNHHDGIVYTSLFEDELDALRAAMTSIMNVFKSLGVGDPNHHFYAKYISIIHHIKIDTVASLSSVLNEYDMITIHLPPKQRTQINVSPKFIANKSSRYYNVNSNLNNVVNKKEDKPCKQCRRNVSEDEDYCWNCGVMDPGK